MADLRHDTPRAMPGAEKERIVLRPRSFETGPPKVVDVIPHEFAESDVEVYHPDGTWLGTISRYHGSLDRKVGRQRVPGKRRVLWSYRTAHRGVYGMYGQVSRADCIRDLLSAYERRLRGDAL